MVLPLRFHKTQVRTGDLLNSSELPALTKALFQLRAKTQRGRSANVAFAMISVASKLRPRPVSRKTSGDGVKKLLMFEEPRSFGGSFRNFRRHRVAFPREAGAALGFVSTLWAKPKSRIRLIRPKADFLCSVTYIENSKFYQLNSLVGIIIPRCRLCLFSLKPRFPLSVRIVIPSFVWSFVFISSF